MNCSVESAAGKPDGRVNALGAGGGAVAILAQHGDTQTAAVDRGPPQVEVSLESFGADPARLDPE